MMRSAGVAIVMVGTLLSFTACTKAPPVNKKAMEQREILKQQVRNQGYAVFVQPPKELKQLLKDHGLYQAFLEGKTTEITPQLEKLIAQTSDPVLQAHLHLLCGMINKKELMDLNNQQLQKKIVHLNKALELSEDASLRCYVYPMLAELYKRVDSLPQALHVLKQCVEECPGIGEGENRFALAASVIGDICSLMDQLKVPAKEQIQYLQGIMSQHPSDQVGLSALYWTAILAKKHGKYKLLEHLKEKVSNYPTNLRERYPDLSEFLQASTKKGGKKE